MSFEIEIYRDGDFVLDCSIPLFPLLRESLGRSLGLDMHGIKIRLLLLPVPEEAALDGTPAIHNLMPDYGYGTVQVLDGDRMIYRHPHTLRELIAEPLRAHLYKRDPGVESWGFLVVGPGLPRTVVRPTPRVHGVTHVDPYAEGEGPAFRIRRVPDPDPPAAALEDFGLAPRDGEREAFAKVLVREEVERDLARLRPFSNDVEEGGFLLGRVYQDRDVAGTYLLEITAALTARHTGASLLHFTFTGDSFEAVKRTLREERPGEQLVGWYHTHLFPATEKMGLSSVDLDLHFTTFRQPWQLAGLVNLDGARRTLRFYVPRAGAMTLCPHWTLREETP